MQDRYAEHRVHARHKVPLRVEVSLESGILVEGTVINISLGGILFETEFMLPMCCPVKVVLSVHGKDSEYKIESQGIVARLDEQGVAIMFSHISAENSTYLHRLLFSSPVDAEEVDSVFVPAGNAELYY
jgi:hypothetical protein